MRAISRAAIPLSLWERARVRAIGRRKGMGRVLDQPQAVLRGKRLHRLHVHHQPAHMHRNDPDRPQASSRRAAIDRFQGPPASARRRPSPCSGSPGRNRPGSARPSGSGPPRPLRQRSWSAPTRPRPGPAAAPPRPGAGPPYMNSRRPRASPRPTPARCASNCFVRGPVVQPARTQAGHNLLDLRLGNRGRKKGTCVRFSVAGCNISAGLPPPPRVSRSFHCNPASTRFNRKPPNPPYRV